VKFINFIMGLIGIVIGSYAIYLTIAEQSKTNRPGPATRIARTIAGLIVIIIGVLAILSATGVIFQTPSPY
jgi:hypothetical protein